MRASEIITHMIQYVPQLSTEFSEQTTPVSTIRNANRLTLTFAEPHGLENNDTISITAARVKTEIREIVVLDGIATATTFTPHDLTETQIEYVNISGTTNEDLNGRFQLVEVINRRSFSFRVEGVTNFRTENVGVASPLVFPLMFNLRASDAGVAMPIEFPMEFEGRQVGMFLEEERTVGNINGVHTISDVTENSYDIELDFNAPLLQDQSIVVHTSIRISGGSDLDKIMRCYEEVPDIGDLYAFVVLGDVTVSKDRNVNNDATLNQGNLNAWNTQLLSPFAVYIFVKTDNDITGRRARDVCEDLRPVLYSVLLGTRFDSQFVTDGGSVTSPLGDGIIGYFDAYYVHEFRFEQIAQVCSDDIMYKDANAANRDIFIDQLDVFNDSDDVKSITRVDLDDEPL